MESINNKTSQGKIDQLKKNIFSVNWELAKSAADRLAEIGGKEITDFLISLLNMDAPSVRNIAALALADIADNRAVEPLLTAIFKKENHNYNGSLVYALKSFDCSKKLKEIFRILFYETYESTIGAYTILDEQIYIFTKEDLLDIEQMWEGCKKHPEKCPCYKDEKMREGIQFMVDNYVAYIRPELLKEKKLIKPNESHHRQKSNKGNTANKE